MAQLAFSSEAPAIETEIGARFGVHKVDDEQGKRHPHLHWHQIYDLLTAYYFNLCGNFRDDVLKSIRPAFTGALPALAEILLASPIHDGRSEGDHPVE